jgi:hypothetical protein
MEGCAVLRFSGRAALAFGWERPLGHFFSHYPPVHSIITVGQRCSMDALPFCRFNFSGCLLRESKSSYICNSGRALRPRPARPANNSFTKSKFNQAWLAWS